MSLSLKDVTGVNPRHPLNRGRVCWWLCLPRTMGGRQWFDLMAKNHGTLTNMGTSISGWRPSARPGGAGCVLFDGTVDYDDRVVAGSLGVAIGTGDFSMSAWVRPLSVSVQMAVVSIGVISPCMYVNVGTGNFGLKIGGTLRGSGANLTAGAWQRILATRNGTTLSFFVNGVPTPTTYTLTTSFANAAVVIGDENPSGSGGPIMDGYIDDVSIWNRGTSAADAIAEYNLSRAGYPGVLLREGDHAF